MWLVYTPAIVVAFIWCVCPRPARRYAYLKSTDTMKRIYREYITSLNGEKQPKRTIKPINTKID